jgi:tetratricopeptide (TPR) repeat protein
MSLNKSKALRTAEKYVLQGKLPAAIDEYRKVVDADPSDLTTINTLGDLYVRAGKIQDAIRNFSRIADSYREGGFTLKAIAMLKKISKLDPTNVDTAMKLANLYSQQGLLVEARQQYLQVADAFARSGQSHKALEAYQKIADLDPANTSVRMKLGDIYSREGLVEQAHDAFVAAGNEFLRKGETEQALTAHLKAITANPDSRQALTSLSSIYTQQNRPEQAINLLCEAFERSPGDVELLTILGRTYLSANYMDDAERTFLSLVQLDRTRYHYILEVARKFLQLEQFDRAAEAMDGCLDVLVSKREEDKAIDFFSKILDRNTDSIAALKRLAQIYLRIRDEQQLIATLNHLADAATSQDKPDDAIVALKELARLEPADQQHLDRLREFGVHELTGVDASDITGSLKSLGYRPEVEDEAFVFRQITEAEIMVGHGKVEQAVELLKEILAQVPSNIQVRLKLKDIYLRAAMMKKAAAECLELASIHESLGESARASDYRAEAKHLNPLLGDEEIQSASMGDLSGLPANLSAAPAENSFGFDFGFSNPQDEPNSANSFNFASQNSAEAIVMDDPLTAFGFQDPTAGSQPTGDFEVKGAAGNWEVHDPENGYSFSFYQSADEEKSEQPDRQTSQPATADQKEGSSRYFDTIVSDKNSEANQANPVAEMLLSATGDLPTDTMPRALRDDLEGVDFYITQGYVDIARDTLDRLQDEYGQHTEITARYKKLRHTASLLGIKLETADSEDPTPGTNTNQQAPSTPQEIDLDVNVAFGVDLPESVNDFNFVEPTLDVQSEDGSPFLVQKESGMLEQDMVLNFNTRDLQKDYELMQTLQAANASKSETSFADLRVDNVPLETGFADQTTGFKAEDAPEKAEAKDSSPNTELGDVEVIDLFDTEMPISDELFGQAEFQNPPSEAFLDSTSPFTDTLWQTDETVVEEPTTEVQKTESTSAVLAEPSVQIAAPKVEPVEITEPRKSSQQEFMLGDFLGLEGDDEEDNELQRMVSDFIEDSGTIAETQDYETHYNLGLAYKDMDLFDEAIEQFQMAFRFSIHDKVNESHIQCCHMLGVCFKQKSMPKVAVMWFKRGLELPNSSENEYQALRYEIGLCYEEMGEREKALDLFMEVYGINVNYRNVNEKIRQLQSGK